MGILRQRMYCLTLYNISPIQQGIQSLHAVVEYANKYAEPTLTEFLFNPEKTINILKLFLEKFKLA